MVSVAPCGEAGGSLEVRSATEIGSTGFSVNAFIGAVCWMGWAKKFSLAATASIVSWRSSFRSGCGWGMGGCLGLRASFFPGSRFATRACGFGLTSSPFSRSSLTGTTCSLFCSKNEIGRVRITPCKAREATKNEASFIKNNPRPLPE